MSTENERYGDWLLQTVTEQVDSEGERPSALHDVSSAEDGDGASPRAQSPVSFVEARADDLDALLARAVVDDVVSALVPDTREMQDQGEALNTVPSSVADDRVVDETLWSLVRENWRRGTPLFGDTVHKCPERAM